MTRPKISIAGKSGQVAQALTRAAKTRGIDLVARGRPDLDVTSLESVADYLRDQSPTLVVNAAAYTAVDKAERELDQVRTANAVGPGLLAMLCDEHRIPLIHLSTDYVFDGTKRSPYVETDPITPLGKYGTSKAAGEAAIRKLLPEHVILRTSWVYSPGGANFVRTMLRLAAQRDVVRVVSDQVGSPTSADNLAGAILDIAEQIHSSPDHGKWGTYHLTGQGETTWHGFAEELFRLAAARGIKTPQLDAIPTSAYPTPARRPAYSVLDNTKIEAAFGIRLRPWQESLAHCLDELILQTQGLAA